LRIAVTDAYRDSFGYAHCNSYCYGYGNRDADGYGDSSVTNADSCVAHANGNSHCDSST
jgi:hypothetical protein